MGGSISFDPGPMPLDGEGVVIATAVFYYSGYDDVGGKKKYTLLPNVDCESVSWREGAEPATARFHYVFDDTDPQTEFPTQFEQVWPLNYSTDSEYVVLRNDRLVVMAYLDDQTTLIVFDGFAQVPQADVSPDGQAVSFIGLGVAIREWDEPIGRSRYRNADKLQSTDQDDTRLVDLPTRFNPDGKINCTYSTSLGTIPDMVVGTDPDPKVDYPVFVDPRDTLTLSARSEWTLGRLVRHLIGEYNPLEKFVTNPDFTKADEFLKARVPKTGTFIDPADSSTYDEKDIIIRDYDASNKAWPEAIWEQMSYHGFGMRFWVEMDDEGFPVNGLHVYRKDPGNAVKPKEVMLQPAYEVLDVGKTNVSGLHVARDQRAMANAFVVETDPIRYEISVVLALGYEPHAGDEADGTRDQFLLSKLTDADAEVRAKYRDYVADEGGDGHWDDPTDDWVTDKPPDLTKAFRENPDDEDEEIKYLVRNRPPERTLISKDSAGKPLHAMLHLSRDYDGPMGVLWDGSGHWQQITEGWTLMKDKIGIHVTAQDVEKWTIGKYKGSDPQNPGAALAGIKSWAAPSTTDQATKKFYLLLTCVVDGDEMMDAQAGSRSSNPSAFTVRRRIDCKDHFRKDVISARSWYNKTPPSGGSTPIAKVKRDDTDKATAHAEALRAAHEFPPMSGSIVIPWVTFAYEIGNRIKRIGGRDASFQGNVGTGLGEAPSYPFIVGKTWEFSPNQRTILEFSDQRTEVERPYGRHS